MGNDWICWRSERRDDVDVEAISTVSEESRGCVIIPSLLNHCDDDDRSD